MARRQSDLVARTPFGTSAADMIYEKTPRLPFCLFHPPRAERRGALPWGRIARPSGGLARNPGPIPEIDGCSKNPVTCSEEWRRRAAEQLAGRTDAGNGAESGSHTVQWSAT